MTYRDAICCGLMLILYEKTISFCNYFILSQTDLIKNDTNNEKSNLNAGIGGFLLEF